MTRVERMRSTELSTAELRAVAEAAFRGRFTEDDLGHALGGVHVVVRDGDAMVAHAALVPRVLEIGSREVRAGYVEAVAVLPERQGQGLGSRAMAEIGSLIREHYDLGALATGRHGFYERLGWERWQGPSYVIEDGRHERLNRDRATR